MLPEETRPRIGRILGNRNKISRGGIYDVRELQVVLLWDLSEEGQEFGVERSTWGSQSRYRIHTLRLKVRK